VVWSSTSNGTASNSSTVKGSLQIRKTDYNAPTTGTFSYHLSVGTKGESYSWYGSLSGDWITISSITSTVPHNSDGSGTAYIKGVVSGPSGTSMEGLTISATKYVTLDKINRQATIKSAPNFNDEENPTITYSNPAGNSVTSLNVYITDAKNTINYVSRENILKTGTSYTFTLTEEERNTLQNATLNSNVLSVRFYIKTIIGENSYLSYLERTLTIINANPEFNDFEWKTINYNDLTGDDKTVIKGFSDIKTVVSEENKATTLKEATLSNYQTTIGSKSKTSTSLEYPVENIVEKVDGASITVFANDSRGNSTPVIKPITNYIEYNRLTNSPLSVSRVTNVGSETNIQFEGEIDIVNFGAVENSIVESKYYYKEIGSTDEYIQGTTDLNAELTQIEGRKYKFEINQNIAGDLGANGFDINKSFAIMIIVNDRISSVQDETTLGTGSPAIAMLGNNVSLGAPYNEELGGRVQINGNDFEKIHSCCKMSTNFGTKSFGSSGQVKVTGWNKNIEFGDYEVDTTNNRLVIKNTKIVEISGTTSGSGYGIAQIAVLNEDERILYFSKNLFQFGGNGYWSCPLATSLVELDPAKTYYVILEAGGYNQNFSMNNGFGAGFTNIQAKKIK
jgi:hypothetical protein